MEQQKPTMELYIDELFKTNFSLFNDLDEEVRLKQIKTVNYISNIANQLDKNIKGINLFDIIKNNNNIFIATEAEINKALVSFDRTEIFTVPKTKLLSKDQFERC